MAGCQNLALLLKQGVNGACPEEMVELPVVKWTAADYQTKYKILNGMSTHKARNLNIFPYDYIVT